MAFHQNRAQPAKLSIYDRHVNPKVAISFDQETARRLQAMAANSRRPFGAVVRELVARALNQDPAQ